MDSSHNGSFAADQEQATDPFFYKHSPQRILILAPHPDDETLAAGGMIATALTLGVRSQIRVIVATNGDASYSTVLLHGYHLATQKSFQQQAVLRQQESLRALALLGLDAGQIHFWGFPDRGLATLWKNRQKNEHLFRSSTTGFSESIQALNSSVLPFTGDNLVTLIKQELSDFLPTMIIMPHPQDQHSDHSALAGFTLHAMQQIDIQQQEVMPALYAYWMWQKNKPWLTGMRPQDIGQVAAGKAAALKVRRLALSPEVREKKRRALLCYPSQRIAAGKLFREAAHATHETFIAWSPILQHV